MEYGEPGIVSVLDINGQASGIAEPVVVTKPWGWERWTFNSPLYCQKLIHIDHAKSCSMHLHVRKHECLLVVSGRLTIEAIINKQTRSFDLIPGQAFVIAPGFPHRLLALTGEVELVEASTQHFESDSVKLA